MKFQALNWTLQNKPPGRGGHPFDTETQVVHVSGRSHDGVTVHCAITGWKPSIYARCSEDQLREALRKHTPTNRRPLPDWAVHSTARVQRRVYQGFANGQGAWLLRITIANKGCLFEVVKALASARDANGRPYELFNTRHDPLCTFLSDSGFVPCGWYEVQDAFSLDEDDLPHGYQPSRCDHEYALHVSMLKRVDDKGVTAPFRIASVDIEACAPVQEDGSYPFPDPEKGHPISCICVYDTTVTSDSGSYAWFSYRHVDRARLVHVCNEENLANVDHAASASCTSEREMLAKFIAYFAAQQFDIVVGWNILNFDLYYIYKRCEALHVDVRPLAKWNDATPPRLTQTTLSTAGAGHNQFRSFPTNGVLQCDALVITRRECKFESYTLGAVSHQLLGTTKLDEKPHEIHRKSQGTAAELAEIVAYCMKDCLLPHGIMMKRQAYTKQFAFANISIVPLDYLITRGAMVKTASLLHAYIERGNMVVSNKERHFNRLDGKYEGATVLDAKQGYYSTTPVATLDFKSLYPSIMISQLLCPSTFVESEQYLGLPGIEYKHFDWVDQKSGHRHSYYVATNTESIGCPALLPTVLSTLWQERDKAKRRMKQASTPDEKSIRDGEQLACKLLMNSIYGFFGAVTSSPIPHLPIAMITTLVGRRFIDQSQKFVLARYGRFDPPIAELGTVERMALSLDELTGAAREGSPLNVYGDTDSVFIKWAIPDEVRAKGDRAVMEESFRLSEEASAEITAWLLDHHCPLRQRVELEFEKVYMPLLLYSKKRYAGVLWTKLDKYDYLDYKGIQIVRRDTPPLLKSVLEDCFKLVMLERRSRAAYDLVEGMFQRILRSDFHPADLAKSGAVSDANREYKGTVPPAAEVASLLRKRGLPVPDRIAYVYVLGDPRAKATTKVDSPGYVAQTDGVDVDVAYVASNVLASPLLELLGPAVEGLDALVTRYIHLLQQQTATKEAEFKRRAIQDEQQTRPLTSFFARRHP